MEMDRLCEELDEAKAELKKLRADLRCKTELSENLSNAYNDQLVQLKEASAKIVRQGQELSEKSEEISEVKQTCDSLRCSLNEKDSIIKHLSTVNDRLRVDCKEKNQKWEEEKRRLVLAYDEANEKNEDQDRTIRSLKAEVQGLGGLLSASKKKCVEVEKAPKGLRESEEVLFKLEEQNRKVAGQLKWKKEQFKHLEEAHEKLQVQFKESKEEWELEISTLVDKICSLQSSLDSQNRISEDLKKRLQMCNHALAHEESRRKYLEIEVSELKSRFESVFTECQDKKSQLECLTTQRDKEIAALRSSLGNKEMLYKETEYRERRLEQENQELLASLKELQEAQIQELGNSSLAKLRSKLRSVEQMHRDCSAKLKAKEAEWSSQLDNLTRELKSYRSDLECKEEALKDLEFELENCYSLIMRLKLQNEEESVMLLVLKSGIAEAELNLEEQQLLMQEELKRCKEMLEESFRKQRLLEERASNMETELSEKLREVCDALNAANFDLSEERQKVASLTRRSESLDLLEEKQLMMQNEIVRYKEMLKESFRCQGHLEEQAVQKQNEYNKKLHEVYDALDKVNSELADKVCEGHAVEFELWIWKSIAERLEDEFEENQALRKQLEASLIAQIEVGETIRHEKDGLVDMLNLKDSSIANLQQQIKLYEEEMKTKESAIVHSGETEAVLSFESEKESIVRIAREKDQVLEDLQKEIGWLEEESLRRELEVAVFAQKGAERSFEHEKDYLMKLVEEREQRMTDLMQHVTSLEQQYNSSLISFSSELAKKQTEIMLVHEAWEKIAAAEILAQLEIEEKKLMITELEDDIYSIQQKLELQIQSSSYSKEQALKIEADLEAKQLELKELIDIMATKLRMSEALVLELKTENRILVQDVKKLCSEREGLLDFIGGLSNRITQFSSEDMQLMGTLQRIVQSLDCDGSFLVHKGDSEMFEYAKENVNSHPSPTTMKSQVTREERSPFRELN